MSKRQKLILKIAAAVLAFFTALHIFFSILPYPELDLFLKRDFSTRVYDRKNNLVQITPLQNGLRREFISSEQIPRKIKEEFIKAEDKRFCFHWGFDPFAVGRAFFQNVSNKKNVSGASTITMQLAKIINDSYNNQTNEYRQGVNRNLTNKLNETICALKLEARFSKDEILELYLNSIPFGNNVEGIQSASRLYFSKDVKDLTNEEITTLAMIPRRPSYYSPESKYKYPFYMPHLVRYLGENNYFLNAKDVQSKTYRSSMPYEVHLSADLELQRYAQECADNAIRRAKDSRISNISVLVMDVQTGHVLAWVGSNNFLDEESSGQIDGVRFKNQPGSSFKPLLYALALDKGIVKPTDIIADVPKEFGIEKAYIPFNFNNRFNGPVSLRVCLASSLNIPAVYLLDKLGVDVFVEKLEDLHFSNIKEIAHYTQLGLALGGGEVSLYEFLPAFTVFARDGKYIPLRFLSDKYHGSVNKTEPVEVYSEDSARIVADFLSEKNARSLGFGYYQTFETDYPSIFKTGTSNQYQNITALGATPRYAVGVWMGNFSGETVIGKTGSSLPASVAKKILDYLENFDDKESLNFSQPEGYEKVQVCQVSGMKPGPNCVSSVYEYVKKGEEKTACTWHRREEGKTVVHYPNEYQYWLEMNNGFYSSDRVKIDYSAMPLKIVYPRNDAVFYLENNKKQQRLNLEVTGGVTDEIQIYIDDSYYASKRRPFILQIPLEKGNHKCKVICGNQENIVFYEVR